MQVGRQPRGPIPGEVVVPGRVAVDQFVRPFRQQTPTVALPTPDQVLGRVAGADLSDLGNLSRVDVGHAQPVRWGQR
ncbi:hypothetical protein [Saccharopolyspora karakumensis]|uniref:hypothetical protein n=1 Tax=Saccharopolyspora karakumensis TaxID=2530386 RepID=UPI001F2B6C4C|nr:hypothetical protein [Saccharopolyspora karakumensis]